MNFVLFFISPSPSQILTLHGVPPNLFIIFLPACSQVQCDPNFHLFVMVCLRVCLLHIFQQQTESRYVVFFTLKDLTHKLRGSIKKVEINSQFLFCFFFRLLPSRFHAIKYQLVILGIQKLYNQSPESLPDIH